MKQFQYLSNCVEILDLLPDVFSDATEMAQTIENGEELSFAQFKEICFTDPEKDREVYANPERFTFGRNEGVAWMYDKNTDIHYFYGS